MNIEECESCVDRGCENMQMEDNCPQLWGSSSRRIWNIDPPKRKKTAEYIKDIIAKFRKEFKYCHTCGSIRCQCNMNNVIDHYSFTTEQMNEIIKAYFMKDLKFKKLHEDAVLPFYGTEFAAGMDCVTVSEPEFEDTYVCYNLGFAMEVPAGHVGLLFPRSSNSKKDLLLSNSVGVIDEDYRGEVQARFKDTFMSRGLFVGTPSGIEPKYYAKGDAVCQLIIIPVARFNAMWADELSDTVRGDGGFGSTNK